MSASTVHAHPLSADGTGFASHRATTTAPPKVLTFFYGSFMNLDVLGQLGLVRERFEVAVLSGFAITVRPLPCATSRRRRNRGPRQTTTSTGS